MNNCSSKTLARFANVVTPFWRRLVARCSVHWYGTGWPFRYLANFADSIPSSIKSLRRWLGIIAFSIGLSACAGAPTFVGYSTHSDDVVIKELAPPAKSGKAILLRDVQSNLLDLRIGGPVSDGELASTIPDRYSALMTFVADIELPADDPSVFIPLLTSNHFSAVEARVSTSKRSVSVSLKSDRLGLDLLYASLVSPGGLQGFVSFPHNKIVLPVDGQASRPEFAWARLYRMKNFLGANCMGIENISEYTYAISSIRSDSFQQNWFNQEIEPFNLTWKCFAADELFFAKRLSVIKSRIKKVPAGILQQYRLNPLIGVKNEI